MSLPYMATRRALWQGLTLPQRALDVARRVFVARLAIDKPGPGGAGVSRPQSFLLGVNSAVDAGVRPRAERMQRVWSNLRRPERVELRTDMGGTGQAALPLPDVERALECLARFVDPAGALEHVGEVLVG